MRNPLRLFDPKPNNDADFRIPRQCIWLKLNGSWPLNSVGTSWESIMQPHGNFVDLVYTLWSWYVIASVGLTIYFQTAFLVHSFGDIIMLTENCCTTFMGALNFVRLLHMRLHQQQFKDLIEQFVKHIWIPKNTHPLIEHECERNMRTYRIMTVLLFCLILMYCILPFVEYFVKATAGSAELPFPYKMLFPYDAHQGWRYLATYLFTSYAGICVVTTLFAEDSLFGFFVTYTCGQFRILHDRLDHLMVLAQSRTIGRDAASLHREYVWQLNQIAHTHNKLIRFARHLENFFNSILLVNFTVSSILICMVGFQLVTGKDMFIGDYVKFVVYISSSLSQLYIMCWNGDTLIQLSTETAKHLYACNWEGGGMSRSETRATDNWQRMQQHVGKRAQRRNQLVGAIWQQPTNKEFRSNLQFMIMCSQQPVKITALKFSTLSLQTFTALLSTSLSYFTLLQTLYNENQN